MNYLLKLSQVLTLLIITTSLTAQQDPFFMPFEGNVYKLPAKKVMDKKFGYSQDVFEYEKIGRISWKQINIKENSTEYPFPDVDRLDRFGMVLDSEMIVKQDGCYEFILNSDDGSILWIDYKKILDNDHTHKMTMVRDTISLKEGRYPIKLWYYQGFKNKYGFIFDTFYLSESCPTESTLDDFTDDGKLDLKSNRKNLAISNHLLYDINSTELKESARATLDSLFMDLYQFR